MSKREKVIIAICLLVSICFGSLYSNQVAEYNALYHSYETWQNYSGELESANENLEEEIADARVEIRELKQRESNHKKQVSSLNITISDLRWKLDKATTAASQQTSKPSSSDAIKPPAQSSQPPQQVTYYVWCSRTGTKYHSNSNCSNMKNPIYSTLSNAIASGRGACSKCY